MELNRLFGIILLFISPLGLKGQQDSMLSISSDTILLYSSVVDQQINGGSKMSLDGNQIFHLENSAIQIQSNGPGILATPLIHGMGARHTAILWNGVNLQSPVNGTMDLNLISLKDEVAINSSSVSPLVGTNGLAGSISVQSLDRNRVSAQWNNMDNFQLKVGKGVKAQNYSFHLNASIFRNNNQFNYRDFGIVLKRENAHINGVDIESNNQWWINNNVKIVGHIWFQDFNRSVAPSKTAIYNNANQDDQNLRTQIGIVLNKGHLKYSLLSEGIIYQDASVYSDARSNSSIVNAEYDLNLFQGSVLFRNDRVKATFFQETRKRNTFSLQLSRTFQPSSQIEVAMHLRSENYSDFRSPLLYLIETRYRIQKYILWKSSFDRSYNIPSFNDLFWPTGGNPDLLPEKSYGFMSEVAYKKNATSVSLNLFSKNVSDWIIWSPGINFWSPSNQRRVWSRGLDSYASYSWFLNGMEIFTSANYHFTMATIQEDDRFDRWVGNQLIYVPLHRWGGLITFKTAKFKAGLEYKSMGNRYTTFDNLESVGSFQTVDLKVTFNVNPKLKASLSVYNLLNEDYERVAFFAMPLRNVSLRVDYSID